jgi:hypothetical protein
MPAASTSYACTMSLTMVRPGRPSKVGYITRNPRRQAPFTGEKSGAGTGKRFGHPGTCSAIWATRVGSLSLALLGGPQSRGS